MIDRILAKLTINAVIVALLVGALVAQTVRIEGFKIWPLSIKGMKAELADCKDGREKDRKAYKAAQDEAKAKNLESVRKVEQQQRAINDEVTRDLNARLERLRRELRANAAAKGAAGSAGKAEGGNKPGAPEEAGVCLAPEELLRGAENEERHDQLITVVERLLKLLNTPD